MNFSADFMVTWRRRLFPSEGTVCDFAKEIFVFCSAVRQHGPVVSLTLNLTVLTVPDRSAGPPKSNPFGAQFRRRSCWERRRPNNCSVQGLGDVQMTMMSLLARCWSKFEIGPFYPSTVCDDGENLKMFWFVLHKQGYVFMAYY